jgi:hypothetical protein
MMMMTARYKDYYSYAKARVSARSRVVRMLLCLRVFCRQAIFRRKRRRRRRRRRRLRRLRLCSLFLLLALLVLLALLPPLLVLPPLCCWSCLQLRQAGFQATAGDQGPRALRSVGAVARATARLRGDALVAAVAFKCWTFC